MTAHRALRCALLAALVALAAACGTDEPGSFLANGDTDDGDTVRLADRYQLTVWSGNPDSQLVIKAAAGPYQADDGTTLLMTHICSATLPKIESFSPYIEDSVLQGIYLAFPMEVGEDTFQTGVRPLQLGVSLDDPMNGSVPTNADDPQVVDIDEDGHPGISIHTGVLGRLVYAGMNAVFALDGTFNTPGNAEVISGSITMTLDRQIYDDNIPFYNARKSADNAGMLGVSQESATFELTALPSTGSTDANVRFSCADVL